MIMLAPLIMSLLLSSISLFLIFSTDKTCVLWVFQGTHVDWWSSFYTYIHNTVMFILVLKIIYYLYMPFQFIVFFIVNNFHNFCKLSHVFVYLLCNVISNSWFLCKSLVSQQFIADCIAFLSLLEMV